jgi:hypothetical protein
MKEGRWHPWKITTTGILATLVTNVITSSRRYITLIGMVLHIHSATTCREVIKIVRVGDLMYDYNTHFEKMLFPGVERQKLKHF